MIGEQIGDYKVVRQLGEGGMGAVFLGQHALLSQKVAIKALQPALFSNENSRARFLREAEVLARLNHPNVIRLLNFHSLPQGCFIVMEYVEGETLDDKVQKTGPQDPKKAVPWFVQCLSALAYAHKQGVVHRDLKPANIIITADGTTKVLDFGTAKLADAKQLTQQGMTIGTLHFMSMEQLLGKPLDGRSDVYSLGVTLYETVTGRLPFHDEDPRRLTLAIIKQPPVPPRTHNPAVSVELENVILKAMLKDAKQRFQSAEEFSAALSALK